MNPTLARLLTRLYPRRWRERYSEEFAAHLENGANSLGTIANVVSRALYEHILGSWKGSADAAVPAFGEILRQPSALMPISMSLIALTMVLSLLAVNGVVHEADEGAEAHIWQLLMGGQLPIVLFFAIKWLPRAPRQTLPVLALQAAAALASMAPVLFLHM